MALHDDEDVAFEVLARHEPGRVLAGGVGPALDAADTQALPLAQGVEGQADMLPNAPTALVLDGAGLVAQVAVEEFAERPLADEADAGRILLRSNRQADLGSDAPHLGLLQFTDREQALAQLGLVQAVQEIALV